MQNVYLRLFAVIFSFAVVIASYQNCAQMKGRTIAGEEDDVVVSMPGHGLFTLNLPVEDGNNAPVCENGVVRFPPGNQTFNINCEHYNYLKQLTGNTRRITREFLVNSENVLVNSMGLLTRIRLSGVSGVTVLSGAVPASVTSFEFSNGDIANVSGFQATGVSTLTLSNNKIANLSGARLGGFNVNLRSNRLTSAGVAAGQFSAGVNLILEENQIENFNFVNSVSPMTVRLGGNPACDLPPETRPASVICPQSAEGAGSLSLMEPCVQLGNGSVTCRAMLSYSGINKDNNVAIRVFRSGQNQLSSMVCYSVTHNDRGPRSVQVQISNLTLASNYEFKVYKTNKGCNKFDDGTHVQLGSLAKNTLQVDLKPNVQMTYNRETRIVTASYSFTALPSIAFTGFNLVAQCGMSPITLDNEAINGMVSGQLSGTVPPSIGGSPCNDSTGLKLVAQHIDVPGGSYDAATESIASLAPVGVTNPTTARSGIRFVANSQMKIKVNGVEKSDKTCAVGENCVCEVPAGLAACFGTLNFQPVGFSATDRIRVIKNMSSTIVGCREANSTAPASLTSLNVGNLSPIELSVRAYNSSTACNNNTNPMTTSEVITISSIGCIDGAAPVNGVCPTSGGTGPNPPDCNGNIVITSAAGNAGNGTCRVEGSSDPANRFCLASQAKIIGGATLPHGQSLVFSRQAGSGAVENEKFCVDSMSTPTQTVNTTFNFSDAESPSSTYSRVEIGSPVSYEAKVKCSPCSGNGLVHAITRSGSEPRSMVTPLCAPGSEPRTENGVTRCMPAQGSPGEPNVQLVALTGDGNNELQLVPGSTNVFKCPANAAQNCSFKIRTIVSAPQLAADEGLLVTVGDQRLACVGNGQADSVVVAIFPGTSRVVRAKEIHRNTVQPASYCNNKIRELSVEKVVTINGVQGSGGPAQPQVTLTVPSYCNAPAGEPCDFVYKYKATNIPEGKSVKVKVNGVTSCLGNSVNQALGDDMEAIIPAGANSATVGFDPFIYNAGCQTQVDPAISIAPQPLYLVQRGTAASPQCSPNATFSFTNPGTCVVPAGRSFCPNPTNVTGTYSNLQAGSTIAVLANGNAYAPPITTVPSGGFSQGTSNGDESWIGINSANHVTFTAKLSCPNAAPRELDAVVLKGVCAGGAAPVPGPAGILICPGSPQPPEVCSPMASIPITLSGVTSLGGNQFKCTVPAGERFCMPQPSATVSVSGLVGSDKGLVKVNSNIFVPETGNTSIPAQSLPWVAVDESYTFKSVVKCANGTERQIGMDQTIRGECAGGAAPVPGPAGILICPGSPQPPEVCSPMASIPITLSGVTSLGGNQFKCTVPAGQRFCFPQPSATVSVSGLVGSDKGLVKVNSNIFVPETGNTSIPAQSLPWVAADESYTFKSVVKCANGTERQIGMDKTIRGECAGGAALVNENCPAATGGGGANCEQADTCIDGREHIFCTTGPSTICNVQQSGFPGCYFKINQLNTMPCQPR